MFPQEALRMLFLRKGDFFFGGGTPLLSKGKNCKVNFAYLIVSNFSYTRCMKINFHTRLLEFSLGLHYLLIRQATLVVRYRKVNFAYLTRLHYLLIR